MQSPNFNPQRPFSGFDTPANQPVLRNVLNTGGLQLSGSGGKGQLGMMGNRRPSFLNPSESGWGADLGMLCVGLRTRWAAKSMNKNGRTAWHVLRKDCVLVYGADSPSGMASL